MNIVKFSAAALVASVAFAGAAAARDQIQVAGSSTVLPYAKIVAETFAETFPNFKAPVVESGGTGGGLKAFCSGVGEGTIDIANASRKIKSDELAACKAAGVADVQEVKIGYDGIVFAMDSSNKDIKLEPKDLYLALAAEIVKDGKLVANPYKKWSEINKELPDVAIAAYIPGSKHGTREVFEEKIMADGCKEAGATDAIKKIVTDAKQAAAKCVAVRKDGAAVDIDGDYTETLARIDANKTGLGVFGLAFYENNADRLKVATVSGVVPSTETVASGKYPVSRPLFFYVKKAHLGVIPGLKEYVEFFVSDEMIGPDSPLANYGLVAAPDAEREEIRSKFSAGSTM
ncbi:phosphonate ABC transporter substrate-binding protein [Agrobacterium deltaense]|jgi:phosphate transport system substrate-binding protein|uniref:Phosphate ABC transporter, periplasmic phosphate-binding protein PstS n=4 Tax=Agrobacterium TaxID=357 RepID=A0A1S7TPC5_9HYPH|nr:MULTISPECIES: substrate-binding domain-containing protein [Agrobacterium]AFM38870.1 phosphate ABC transporter, periplasmic phosphate-binding protein PstS [Agrobacterium tumefaciens GW4]KDR86346.1 phosphonate ABC transporter substrate-binding protein [Agrobacterium tumefaciens GW4]KVK44898.1 phosphonate ABC transporter substrate-binding protein [Agrobacterium sp. D14]KVK52345.1 phosphonate ABC transporter substrate-binding protein [Agrobacterium sp. JL28]MBG0507917.1 substrate-binding domain